MSKGILLHFCLTLNFSFMKEKVDAIFSKIEVFKTNATAFVDKGNKAAGARARKASLELTKLFKEFRQESVEAK